MCELDAHLHACTCLFSAGVPALGRAWVFPNGTWIVKQHTYCQRMGKQRLKNITKSITCWWFYTRQVLDACILVQARGLIVRGDTCVSKINMHVWISIWLISRLPDMLTHTWSALHTRGQLCTHVVSSAHTWSALHTRGQLCHATAHAGLVWHTSYIYMHTYMHSQGHTWMHASRCRIHLICSAHVLQLIDSNTYMDTHMHRHTCIYLYLALIHLLCSAHIPHSRVFFLNNTFHSSVCGLQVTLTPVISLNGVLLRGCLYGVCYVCAHGNMYYSCMQMCVNASFLWQQMLLTGHADICHEPKEVHPTISLMACFYFMLVCQRTHAQSLIRTTIAWNVGIKVLWVVAHIHHSICTYTCTSFFCFHFNMYIPIHWHK